MKTLATLLCGAIVLAGCATVPSARRPLPDNAAIDAEARRLMASEDVKGMAIAVIDNGRVVHVAAYGQRNVEQNLPLQTDTVMYAASLTKVVFAYMVMQLVDEGKLDLDRSIADYLPKPLPEYEGYEDLAGDERWRTLTPRIILNHATGLANLRQLEPDGKLRFHWDPGARYGYSNEGIWVLQTVLQEGLKLDVGAEIQTRLFDRFGMPRTSMKWREDFAGNLADGYDMQGTFEPHDHRDNVAAAGSMDTTITDQSRLWAAMIRGEGLSAASRAEMSRPQLAIPFRSQFPTLGTQTDPRAGQIGLSAAVGFAVADDPTGRLMFRGGHNDWTGNMAVCQERLKRCVVMLGNSVRAELIYPEMTRFVLGDTVTPWWWFFAN